MVQWLRLCASTAGGVDSIPHRGTKIPHAVCAGQKKKKNNEEPGLLRIIAFSLLRRLWRPCFRWYNYKMEDGCLVHRDELLFIVGSCEFLGFICYHSITYTLLTITSFKTLPRLHSGSFPFHCALLVFYKYFLTVLNKCLLSYFSPSNRGKEPCLIRPCDPRTSHSKYFTMY